MESQNSFLLQMPPLVMEKILSNILNLSNVSRTCKFLYESVCQVDKSRRVVCIRRFAAADNSARLTIDDDGVFDSIMNSVRKITKIRVDLNNPILAVELNERQLERLTAITNRFGANIISLKLRGVVVSIDKINGLLKKTPKLESLEFEGGKAFGSATTSLQLLSLKKLSIRNYPGLLEIVNLLPAGSLNEFCSLFQVEDYQPEILQGILSKQHNLKTLRVDGFFDPTVLCVHHLQLEKLELGPDVKSNNDHLVEILKCHMNLKELRMAMNGKHLQPSEFKWISDNLSELEVLRVPVNSDKNTPLMLSKLKKLRHFSTTTVRFLHDYGFQFEIDSLAKLTIQYRSWRSGQDFNHMMQSMVRTFTNLTAIEIPLLAFYELSDVLSQCTKLTHLTTSIMMPNVDQLAQKCFPNIRHLTIDTYPEDSNRGMSVIVSVVRAMPNLKSLWIPNTTIKFNIYGFKEFIHASKSLDELNVNFFKLDDELSATEDLVETIRRLSNQLKAYRLRIVLRGRSYLNTINGIMSYEFNVRDKIYDNGWDYFLLCKDVLSEFRGYD